jgi:hypothetical protein
VIVLGLAALLAQSGPTGDWIIPAGSTVFYDTLSGAAHVNKLIVEPGATLRVVGPRPFVVVAAQEIAISGTLDASGFDAKPVSTLLTPYLPEIGAAGAAGGGRGGTGSPLTTASDAQGGAGFCVLHPLGTVDSGGRGGETGYDGTVYKQVRRGAGGGGGAFGPDVPGGAPGLAATAGGDGHPLGKGALSGGALPAKGGQPGPGAFFDADPTNDFFGQKRDPATGTLITGELALPRPGSGGGAGGDSIPSDVFPTIPFAPIYIDKKGASAGGGGGLVVLISASISLDAGGAIHVDGGDGATGENLLGLDHLGGSSGGGSGGMLILQADLVDLSNAGADALRAIGGIGGADDGMGFAPASLSGGGNGGPGLIQIHVADAAQDLLLPTALGLSALSAPDAHVLLPAF